MTARRSTQQRALAMLRRVALALSTRSRAATVLLDLLLVNVSSFSALWLRFDGHIPDFYVRMFATFAPLVSVTRLACFWSFGLYHHIWRYASISEALAIVKSTSLGSVALIILWLFLSRERPLYPRSVILLEWLFTITLIAGSRFAWRLFREALFGQSPRRFASERAVIVGAGDAGETVARELLRRSDLGVPVGFIDDDRSKHRMSIHGVRVLGGRDRLQQLARDVDRIIIAMPSVPAGTIRQIVDLCQEGTAELLIMPGILGKSVATAAGRLRPIQVEDLLGRPEVRLNLEEIAAYLKDQRVMVTGAGGWIGSELCRQVTAFKPARIILVGHAENDIFDIDLELRRLWHSEQVRTVIADIRDRQKIERLMAQERPTVLFHAAAHKHVPLMEENPDEAVLNNVGGTLNLADAATRFEVGRFILISTDKAVNPTSVMGATKRIAEICLQHLYIDGPTRFVAVRFGNVMESTGSVIPLFKKQIARGGPVTVTHPEMMRYFMTVAEATRLVMQAGAMGRGGEIYVLDMGEPVKIIDLARTMIRLAGLRPDVDIEIRIVGARPGEKLREEILTADEGVVTTRHEKIYLCRPDATADSETLRAAVTELMTSARQGDAAQVKRKIASIASTYGPSELSVPS